MGLEQQQRKAVRRRAAKVSWARRREQHALESAGVIKYAARAVPRQAEAKGNLAAMRVAVLKIRRGGIVSSSL